MTPGFENKGDPLGRFIEECGEALAAAGKCVRFGYESVNPLLPLEQQERNRDWLYRELDDILEAAVKLKNSI
jgi:hypothetical protein